MAAQDHYTQAGAAVVVPDWLGTALHAELGTVLAGAVVSAKELPGLAVAAGVAVP
jgi:hypothetical protein